MARIAPIAVQEGPEKPADISLDFSQEPTPPSSERSSITFVDNEESDISWHYLTFDTLLPPPNPSSDLPNAAAPPPPPDLSKLDNPQDWSRSHKWITVLVSCFGGLMATYSSSAYASTVSDLEQEFGVSFDVAQLGITLYNVGLSIFPMLCAPLSESIGRYHIFTASGILFVVAQICCGVTRNYGGMVISRFLAGCGGSAFNTVVGGVISDLFVADGLNTPMAIFISTALAGVAFGLAVSGAVVQYINWRWVFYIQAIAGALATGLVAAFFRETRRSVVLRRRANAINKWYEQLEEQGYMGVAMELSEPNILSPVREKYSIIRWKVEEDEVRPGLMTLLWISVVRPVDMLFREPVVLFFSLWATFTWGVLYLTWESVPFVLTTTHSFNDLENGLVFLSMLVATVFIALPLCIIFDKKVRSSSRFGSDPESRLFAVCLMSGCLPIGIFWFGWTQFATIPWIVPVLAIGCLTVGIFFVYLAVVNYFADVYGTYASSAIAANSFCRNMVSGVFPYFSNIMFTRLSFQGASSLLGGIAILLMIFPVLLLMNGPKIRRMSKYALV